MDTENIPMIADHELEKFILGLCYRPAFTKRTIPVIVDDMENDINRMMSEIRTPGLNKIRKVQLYSRIEGRAKMILNLETTLKKEGYVHS